MPLVQRVYDQNLRVYGADKVWRQLAREGVEVARCTVERLMRRLGLQGARRGKGVRTTVPDARAACPLDRVNRHFKAQRPNHAGHLQDWLQAGDVEVALIYGQKEIPALQVKAVLEESLWVVAPPSARLSRKRPLQLARVAREPFILPAAPQGLRAAIEHAATAASVTLQVFAETNALNVQKELVAQDHGWTSLPAVRVSPEVERGLPSTAPLAGAGLRRTVVIVPHQPPGLRARALRVRHATGLREDELRPGEVAGCALAGVAPHGRRRPMAIDCPAP